MLGCGIPCHTSVKGTVTLLLLQVAALLCGCAADDHRAANRCAYIVTPASFLGGQPSGQGISKERLSTLLNKRMPSADQVPDSALLIDVFRNETGMALVGGSDFQHFLKEMKYHYIVQRNDQHPTVQELLHGIVTTLSESGMASFSSKEPTLVVAIIL